MDKQIDWSALDLIAEYLEIKNVEHLIDTLLILKEHTEAKNG